MNVGSESFLERIRLLTRGEGVGGRASKSWGLLIREAQGRGELPGLGHRRKETAMGDMATFHQRGGSPARPQRGGAPADRGGGHLELSGWKPPKVMQITYQREVVQRGLRAGIELVRPVGLGLLLATLRAGTAVAFEDLDGLPDHAERSLKRLECRLRGGRLWQEMAGDRLLREVLRRELLVVVGEVPGFF